MKKTAKSSVMVYRLERLLEVLYSSEASCFYQRSKAFFASYRQQQAELKKAEQRWQQLQQAASVSQAERQQARQHYSELQYQDERARLMRWADLHMLAEQLLKLSEGESNSETLAFSARLLGCLQIMVPTAKRQRELVQFAYKPLYRAVLSLRLLDHLLAQQLLDEPALVSHYQLRNRQAPDDCPYRQHVQLPIVMAVLLQDIGLLHPDALGIIQGELAQFDSGRPLNLDERERLLQVSSAASLALLQQGFGIAPYKGNDKAEREQYFAAQQQRLHWLSQLLQLNPADKTLFGSLLKVPQVYASIVLPGRQRFNYALLPKAALLMREGARRNEYNGLLVDQLLRITGLFPQGYGVVFTPLAADNQPQDRYEFAIVNGLYPQKPEQPNCRVVSRQQQYRNTGIDISLQTDYNLYFKAARERLEVLPEHRLKALLNALYQDGEARYLRKLLPRCWQPEQFFTDPAHQNLWQNATMKQN
ncbi:hypothetical protein SAMN06297280_1431 [Arsukibacterium tuosuense]|uniref:Uncharacterized protein n=1 Tax=Arsukibacterium tuosuense TaxID=1323745 RepID=A0A285INB8_9GAMM|nr:hypothetical protein [Arsukibacterium tuosuense]SNY49489.1 hypothetical protein SAMN06297280_1431 [Arsukibacterium tuosuense]